MYEPGQTIIVRRVDATDPTRYVLSKTVRFVTESGKEIDGSTIKPGTKVHIYYYGTGENGVVNRVVIDE
jgi:hypothetical protein